MWTIMGETGIFDFLFWILDFFETNYIFWIFNFGFWIF
jgi:hypothetical protein